jgi:hypothetical protein
MPYCSKCGAGMVSKLDLEDCSQFWDCPNLCIGAKPLAEPRQERRKKAPADREQPSEPPLIEIPIRALPRREEAYSTEPYNQACETGRRERPDTNMAAAGGLPQGRTLRFWTWPRCILCDRAPDLAPDGSPGKYCWVHDDDLWKSSLDASSKARRMELLIRALILIMLLSAAVCATLLCAVVP